MKLIYPTEWSNEMRPVMKFLITLKFETVSAVKWFKHLDLRFFIFRALVCVSLVLKIINLIVLLF
jgi:hypothetical protein